MNEINLIPRKDKSEESSARILKIIRITAAAILGTVAIFAIIVFILRVTSPLNSLKAQEKSLLLKTSLYKKEMITLYYTHDRLKQISQVLTLRPDFTKTIGKIVGKLPGEITIDTVSVDKKSVQMTIAVSNLAAADVFLDELIGLVGEGRTFRSVTLNSLTLDEANGRYLLSLQGKLL